MLKKINNSQRITKYIKNHINVYHNVCKHDNHRVILGLLVVFRGEEDKETESYSNNENQCPHRKAATNGVQAHCNQCKMKLISLIIRSI